MYLLGAHEIHRKLGNISRQRVYQLTGRPSFPRPVVTLACGKVWDGAQVEQWIRDNRGYRPA
jgi:predicted DNA-binding transcriptional regulator AlpA